MRKRGLIYCCWLSCKVTSFLFSSRFDSLLTFHVPCVTNFLTKLVVISFFRSLSPTGRDLSPESPLTPPTVRLRKKAYSDLASVAIPLLSLSADEESPSKPPTASLTVETDDKYRIHRTHSLPAEREHRLSAVPKLELSCKSWDLRILILLASVAGV